MNTFVKKIGSVFSLKALLPLAILGLAGAGAYAIMATAPKASMRPAETVRQTVSTHRAVRTTHRVVVDVMGTVTAARQIELASQVAGRIVAVDDDYAPGGFFAKGENILTIDPKDYELALREVRAEVTEAEYNLKVEQGYQKVSAREWDLLQGDAKASEAESELALRKPHLEKAEADLVAARAKLEQARTDLSRTRVTAPFAAMIQARTADLGAAVSVQEPLATLVGTDEFWIQASVPVDRLDWINLPTAARPEGSAARIVSGSGPRASERTGRVIRLLPSLEDEGRMARVLIAVKDPLNLEGRDGEQPLLLGSYVSVGIEGDVLENVFAIPRAAYRDNDRIWVLKEDGSLDIRTVAPVWKDGEFVVVESGLAEGEAVVTSDLAAPVQGMLLNSIADEDANTGEESNG